VLSTAEPAQQAVRSEDRFDELFERLYAPLYGLTYRVLGDGGEVEETLQEAFLRLAGAAVMARPEGEVAAWLRRVCLNLAFNRLRDRRRQRERLERAGRADQLDPSDGGDPSGALVRREEQERVRRALAVLPERQRDCLLLRHSGYAYAEIATSLGVALGSVGVLLARAERAFREIYREHDDEMP
jgi:RNA polymerase sigma factor (sigma-70 family)